ANPALVERLDRIPLEHAVLKVEGEELPLRVVPREPQRRLCQVVRAEREEIRLFGDFVRTNAGSRELDHRPNEVLGLALRRRGVDGELAKPAQLLLEAYERVHDLDERRLSGPLAHCDGGADDRPHLHLVDLRILEPEAAAARPEHRIRLLEGPNPRPHPVVFRLLERRQKLMEWWIEPPGGHGQNGP